MAKYRQLSDRVRQQIREHHLRPGEKLPSIRQLSQQQGVSKNTVIRAYLALEKEGWIEARDRSGFIVRHRPSRMLSGTVPEPREVRMGATALSVIRAAGDPEGVALGSAHPAVQFPACREFYRLLSRTAYRQAQSTKSGAHYTDPVGDPRLRQQLARRLGPQEGGPGAEDILVTNGAMEAISLALRTVAKAGDTVVVETPAYYGNLNAIEALGMKVLEVPCHPETGIDLSALRETLERWPVRAILVNPTFQNPTGFSMPLPHRRELVTIAAAYDLPIIEDDTFGELFYGRTREPSLGQLDSDGRVITCSSLSKTLHSDLRIGWAIPGRYFEQMAYLKYVSSLASPGVLQETAAAFLADSRYDRHLRRVRRVYSRARDSLLEAIYRYWPQEIRVSRPEGGFLLWCSLPPGTDGDDLFRQAREQGVHIAPGSLFSCSRSFRSYIRLNYATWQDRPRFVGAIRQLGQFLSQSTRDD